MGSKKELSASAAAGLDNEYYDEFGFYSPMPLSRAARREPGKDFPTGPGIGEPLPNFRLPDQFGRQLDLDIARQGRKAIVVFHRSAYW
ncbi:MAG TPA: hypothetical protein VMF50_09095 [Candidatus Binataceae bacterium]|nr:hypothetical protein [Candidatus Binataceae bacterium]